MSAVTSYLAERPGSAGREVNSILTKVIAVITSMISLVFGFPEYSDAEGEVRIVTVHARRYKFSPSEITLKRGQKVKLVLFPTMCLMVSLWRI